MYRAHTLSLSVNHNKQKCSDGWRFFSGNTDQTDRWRKVFVLVPDHLAAVYAMQYRKVLLLDLSKDESRFRPEGITSRRLIGSEPFPSSRVHHGLCSYSTELIPQLVTNFSSSFYVVLTYR
jgi:hypothetical protein